VWKLYWKFTPPPPRAWYQVRMQKTLLSATIVAFVLIATTAATAAPHASAKCRHGNPDTRWKAVFGHFSQPARAAALTAELKKKGFTLAHVQNNGCGDYAVVVQGVDTQQTRDGFTAEAASAGYPGVSYQTVSTDTIPLPKGTWRAIFGTFATVDAANELERKAAERGFRMIDIEYAQPRRWRVAVAGVPAAKSQEFAREARSAGFTVTYDIT
jgi:cell division septation protein DedD